MCGFRPVQGQHIEKIRIQREILQVTDRKEILDRPFPKQFQDRGLFPRQDPVMTVGLEPVNRFINSFPDFEQSAIGHANGAPADPA